MRVDAMRDRALLVLLGLVALSSSARDLDLGIFPSAEPDRVTPTTPSKPSKPSKLGEGAPRPAAQVRRGPAVVDPSEQVARPDVKPAAPALSVEERLKNARSADGMFSLEAVDIPALKRLDPSMTCYDNICVTTRSSVLGYRGMTVCLPGELTVSFKTGRLTGATCTISIATARDVNAAMTRLLGAAATSKNELSAQVMWKAEKRSIHVVLFKGTNIHGVPYEKWSLSVSER